MTLNEFVRTRYNIKDRVRRISEDPAKLVAERDDLPYDEIRMVDGKLQKVVMLNDDEFITIVDLLGYTKEEMELCKNSDLANVWEVYMEQIEITDMGIEALMSSCRDLAKMREDRNELIHKMGD